MHKILTKIFAFNFKILQKCPPKISLAPTVQYKRRTFCSFQPCFDPAQDPSVIGFASFRTDLLKLCHFRVVGAGIWLGYIFDYLRYRTSEHDLSKSSYPE